MQRSFCEHGRRYDHRQRFHGSFQEGSDTFQPAALVGALIALVAVLKESKLPYKSVEASLCGRSCFAPLLPTKGRPTEERPYRLRGFLIKPDDISTRIAEPCSDLGGICSDRLHNFASLRNDGIHCV